MSMQRAPALRFDFSSQCQYWAKHSSAGADMPTKLKLMCFKCCTCHAKAGGANVTEDVGHLRTSVKVLQVLRQPRKMKLLCSKCCACHAHAADVL